MQAGTGSKFSLLHFLHGRCTLGSICPHALQPAAGGGCLASPTGQQPSAVPGSAPMVDCLAAPPAMLPGLQVLL